jgi:hypothetical protein
MRLNPGQLAGAKSEKGFLFFDAQQATSETISLGSSAILDEIDDLDSFAPDTPPQNVALLATECSSENDPHTADTRMYV